MTSRFQRKSCHPASNTSLQAYPLKALIQSCIISKLFFRVCQLRPQAHILLEPTKHDVRITVAEGDVWECTHGSCSDLRCIVRHAIFWTLDWQIEAKICTSIRYRPVTTLLLLMGVTEMNVSCLQKHVFIVVLRFTTGQSHCNKMKLVVHVHL